MENIFRGQMKIFEKKKKKKKIIERGRLYEGGVGGRGLRLFFQVTTLRGIAHCPGPL